MNCIGIRFKWIHTVTESAMSVNINPRQQTVTATRSLRRSGSSVVLTIPPEILQSLDLDSGDEMRLTGNWDTGEITAERVD